MVTKCFQIKWEFLFLSMIVIDSSSMIVIGIVCQSNRHFWECTIAHWLFPKRTVLWITAFSPRSQKFPRLSDTLSSAHYNQYLHIIGIFDAFSAFGFGNSISLAIRLAGIHEQHHGTQTNTFTNANDFMWVGHNAPHFHIIHPTQVIYPRVCSISISQTLNLLSRCRPSKYL